MSKIIVQLVTWNGEKYIPYLFDSIKKQSFKDFELWIWDNASSDKTVERIKRELNGLEVSHKFIENDKNIGFAGGHNELFKQGVSEYILLLNQDMYLAEDCFETMVNYMDGHQNVAATSPRLMNWDFASIEKNGLESSFKDNVDALGLKVFRSRRVIEQYTQQSWSELKKQLFKVHEDGILPVFGVSGAFPLYRRSALKKISFENKDFFDTSYHSYKEDVDLAYRLVSAGYDSVVLLKTFVYHDRSAAGPKNLADRAAVLNKRKQSEWVKFHSYKNHLKTLIKNEDLLNFVKDFPWIFWYEFKKFIWYFLFDRKVLLGLGEIWREKNELWHKRQIINKARIIASEQIRKWWV